MKFGPWVAGFLIVVSSAVQPVAAQNPRSGGDFRGARWGQSPAEVQALESADPIYRDDHLVVYRDRYEDMPANVIYFFVEDRLVMGFAQILADHDDLNTYFDDYEAMKKRLGRELGVPDAENWEMSLPELETDHSLWADALGFGLIKVEAGWLSGETGIALRLSGGKFQGHLMLAHFDRAEMNTGRRAYKEYFGETIGIPNEYFRN